MGIVKPAFQFATAMSTASIAARIEAFASAEVAIILAPVVAALAVAPGVVCSQPDPGDPGIQQSDLEDLVQFADFQAHQAASAKVGQWWMHLMWSTWCDCASGTVLPPDTTTPLPPALLSPGLPSGGPTSPCWDVQHSDNIAPMPATTKLDWTARYLGQTPATTVNDGSGGVTTAYHIPPGVTSIFVSSFVHPGSWSIAVPGTLSFWNATANPLTSIELWNNQQTDWSPQQNPLLPSGSTYWRLDQVNHNAVPVTVEAHISYFCAGQNPGGIDVPCCPPDPLLDQRLTSIEQMLQLLANQLLTGNASLVPTAVHSNLSGSGSVILTRADAAIRVRVTSSLGSWPNNPGSPNYYFSLGFITSYENGSPLKGWRLVYSDQTFPLAAYSDQVGYTLPPGVTVDIIELIAGP